MAKEMIKKNSNIEMVLIENFVSLQKVMVNLSVKLDDLTTKISKLLELFEISAKTLAEKDFNAGNMQGDKRIDTLLEQNRTLAKGLAMMYERNSVERGNQMQNIPPRMQLQEQPKERAFSNMSGGEYQKSMEVGSSNTSPLPENKFKPLPKKR